jgi:hypothetical protein
MSPRLVIDSDSHRCGLESVSLRNLAPGLVAELGQWLKSSLRVKVVETGGPDAGDLPDVLGRYQILDAGIRFIPQFPFVPGIRYLASFDPRLLDLPECPEVLTLEFSPPKERYSEDTQVNQVFPSGDSLPENLLRFYICFSNAMQRGWAEENIRLFGPDGSLASDVLYRPPVELWDTSMRHLTILLDPGRLKRWVGPNRELGPPLKAGQEYRLVIGSGMIDSSGYPLQAGISKSFFVTEAVREAVAIEQWVAVLPATNSRQPYSLLFPRPLDWALLWHAITIVSEPGQPIEGRIAIDQAERRWSFTPRSPWLAGSYFVRVAVGLEDVCGNNLLGAFDRPLRSGHPTVAAEGSDFSLRTGEPFAARLCFTLAPDRMART